MNQWGDELYLNRPINVQGCFLVPKVVKKYRKFIAYRMYNFQSVLFVNCVKKYK